MTKEKAEPSKKSAEIRAEAKLAEEKPAESGQLSDKPGPSMNETELAAKDAEIEALRAQLAAKDDDLVAARQAIKAGLDAHADTAAKLQHHEKRAQALHVEVISTKSELESTKAKHAAHKQETANLLREAQMRSPLQAAAPGGWDKPETAIPGIPHDRVRQNVHDQIMHYVNTNHDMPRGVKSTCRELLARIRRLEEQKLTPLEAALKPHLVELEARGYKPRAP